MKTQLASGHPKSTFSKDCSYLFIAVVGCLVAGLFCYTVAIEMLQNIEVPNPSYDELLTALRHVS